MKERPIIFSGPMVRAILDGRKTQTRRPVDMTNPHRPISFLGGEGEEDDPGEWGYHFDGPDHNGYAVLARGLDERHNHGRISIRCPYGDVGDRLWVRETWYCDDYTAPNWWTAAGRSKKTPSEATMASWKEHLYYRADATETGTICELIPECLCDGKSPWRPSIFMPRWASRITLEITEVRVQRLQEISEADARAEGCAGVCGGVGQMIPGPPLSAREDFERLWDSINAKRSPWAETPWVWAISFKLVESLEMEP